MDLRVSIVEYELAMHRWIEIQVDAHPEKERALELAEQIAEQHQRVSEWLTPAYADALAEQINSVLLNASSITSTLTALDTYEDPFIVFAAQDLIGISGAFSVHCREASSILQELLAKATLQQGSTYNDLKNSALGS